MAQQRLRRVSAVGRMARHVAEAPPHPHRSAGTPRLLCRRAPRRHPPRERRPSPASAPSTPCRARAREARRPSAGHATAPPSCPLAPSRNACLGGALRPAAGRPQWRGGVDAHRTETRQMRRSDPGLPGVLHRPPHPTAQGAPQRRPQRRRKLLVSASELLRVLYIFSMEERDLHPRECVDDFPGQSEDWDPRSIRPSPTPRCARLPAKIEAEGRDTGGHSTHYRTRDSAAPCTPLPPLRTEGPRTHRRRRWRRGWRRRPRHAS